jgi:hypothetical protein
MKLIQIFKDGRMDEIKYNGKTVEKFFHKISKSQGSGDIKKLYTWEYDNSKIICYGWYDGEYGFENIHDLPRSGKSDFIEEDSSIKKIYGDIFILKYKVNYLDINIGEYSVFYSDQYGEYGDYNSDDVVDEEEEDKEEYKYDATIEEYEIINHSCAELDYDNNEY